MINNMENNISIICAVISIVCVITVYFNSKRNGQRKEVLDSMAISFLIVAIILFMSFKFCVIVLKCKIPDNLSFETGFPLFITLFSLLSSTAFTFIGAIATGKNKRQQDEENQRIAEALERIEEKLNITDDINSIKDDLQAIKQSQRPFLFRLLDRLCTH